MNRRRRRRERQGFVLIVVLVVVVLLSLAAYAFVDRMAAEQKAVRLHAARVQSRLAAESGAEYVARLMSEPAPGPNSLPIDLSDNAARFCAVRLLPLESAGADELTPTPRFTVIAPPQGDGAEVAPARYGLVDESSKLNLLALAAWDQAQPGSGRKALLALPEMTPELADRILDYVDADAEPREQGAEPPRQPPPRALADLLAIEGLTPELLFGQDRDRNGRLDSAENAQGVSSQPANPTPGSTTGALPPGGWSTWLTLVSAESPLAPDGAPRIDLNTDDLPSLHAALRERFDEAAADFVVAWRQFGPAPTAGAVNPTTPLGAASPAPPATTTPRTRTPRLADSNKKPAPAKPSPESSKSSEKAKPSDSKSKAKSSSSDKKAKLPPKPTRPADIDPASAPGSFRLTSAYDLLGASVAVPGSPRRAARTLTTPWPSEDAAKEAEFEQFLDATATQAAPLVGRVNVLAAPREVLAAVPGLEPRLVDALVAARGSGASARSDRRSLAWLLRDKLLTLPELRALAPRLTTAGSVVSAQIVGFIDPAGPVERFELVVDATVRPPRQLSWKSLARQGRGYPPAVLDPMSAATPAPERAAAPPSLAAAP